jgi:hypothetical protein
MEQEAETLRRRIALYRSHLRAGVVGSLAIKYLRQIAEDDEALRRLRDQQCRDPWDCARAIPCG